MAEKKNNFGLEQRIYTHQKAVTKIPAGRAGKALEKARKGTEAGKGKRPSQAATKAAGGDGGTLAPTPSKKTKTVQQPKSSSKKKKQPQKAAGES